MESKLTALRKAYAIVRLIQKPNEVIAIREYQVRMERQENFKSNDELDSTPDSGIMANTCARHKTIDIIAIIKIPKMDLNSLKYIYLAQLPPEMSPHVNNSLWYLSAIFCVLLEKMNKNSNPN